MKLNFGPVHMVGLGVCVFGIGFQTLGIGSRLVGALGDSEAVRNAPVKLGGGAERMIVKSQKKREKMKRRAYFPFKDLESPDVSIERSMVLSKKDEFILESEERRGILSERNRLKNYERNWRALGLGPKHPDVLTASGQIDRMEEVIWDQWREDPRSGAKE